MIKLLKGATFPYLGKNYVVFTKKSCIFLEE